MAADSHPLATTAKAVKVNLLLDPAPLAGFDVPNGQPHTRLLVQVAGRTMRATLNSKSLRKAIGLIRQHGPEAVACVLQGKLGSRDAIEEAGLNVQPKQPKAAPAPERAAAA